MNLEHLGVITAVLWHKMGIFCSEHAHNMPPRPSSQDIAMHLRNAQPSPTEIWPQTFEHCWRCVYR